MLKTHRFTALRYTLPTNHQRTGEREQHSSVIRRLFFWPLRLGDCAEGPDSLVIMLRNPQFPDGPGLAASSTPEQQQTFVFWQYLQLWYNGVSITRLDIKEEGNSCEVSVRSSCWHEAGSQLNTGMQWAAGWLRMPFGGKKMVAEKNVELLSAVQRPESSSNFICSCFLW